MKSLFCLGDCSRSQIPFIESACQGSDSSDYMSRVYPDDTVDIYFWKMIISDGEDIGHVWLEKTERNDTLKLGIAIWDDTKRGLGIGSAVIQLAIKSVLSGVRVVRFVDLNVREKNARAIACYEKAGFKMNGKDVRQKDGEIINIVKMRYDLYNE